MPLEVYPGTPQHDHCYPQGCWVTLACRLRAFANCLSSIRADPCMFPDVPVMLCSTEFFPQMVRASYLVYPHPSFCWFPCSSSRGKNTVFKLHFSDLGEMNPFFFCVVGDFDMETPGPAWEPSEREGERWQRLFSLREAGHHTHNCVSC